MADVIRLPCPTCTGPTRETVGMVCQTCGTDYAPDPIAARIARIEAAKPAPESAHVVEKVARALWEAQQGAAVTPWDDLSELSPSRKAYRGYALAAVVALDEVTR